MEATPKLVGIAGHVNGEEYPLEYGKKVVVGRSRSADWSLVKLECWKSKSNEEQEADHAFRTISGKHFEITMFNLGSIELVNLSSNGTRLDGEPVDRKTITDISSSSHEIAFGADEVLRLEVEGGSGAAGESEAAKELDKTLDRIDGEEDKSDDEAGDKTEEDSDDQAEPDSAEKAEEDKKEE